MSRLISRDPFARQELHSEVVTPQAITGYNNPLECKWCGQTRKNGRLFKYSTQTDGGKIHYHKGEFCSLSCHNSYHI